MYKNIYEAFVIEVDHFDLIKSCLQTENMRSRWIQIFLVISICFKTLEVVNIQI